MAARKKPAIQLHNEGIIDDVIVPLAKKALWAARKPVQKNYAKKVTKIPAGMSPDKAGVYGSMTGKSLRGIDAGLDAILKRERAIKRAKKAAGKPPVSKKK